MGVIYSMFDFASENKFKPLKQILKRDKIADDIYVENVYNFASGLPINSMNLHYLLESNDYFFHGTRACSALLIMRDGFKIAPKGSRVSGSMLGPGVYVSDNIRKTFAYGNFVFICKISPKKQLEVKNIGNWVKQMENLPDISEYDSVFMKGTYDRFDNINEERLLINSSSRFNEYTMQNLDAIKIEYVMQLKRYDYEKTEPRLLCEIDIKSNEFKQFKDFTSRIKFTHHWYIICDLSFVLAYTRFNKTDYIDENFNKITLFKAIDSLTASLTIPKLTDSIDKFIVKANLYEEDGKLISTQQSIYTPNIQVFNNVGIDIEYVYYITDEK